MNTLAWPPIPQPHLLWLLFAVAVPLLLAADLLATDISLRAARIKTVAYGAGAALFALALALAPSATAKEDALAFAAAYVVELALSIDNLFVFLLLFDAFAVQKHESRRVLQWGIWGALLLRAACIAAGAALLHQFAWLFYVFGAVLVLSACKLLISQEESHKGAEEMLLVRLARRFLPMATPEAAKARPGAFFVRVAGRIAITPLLLLLVAIEASDIVFALDSVPAGFAITTNPWLIYAANVWAILGLRALYVSVAGALANLRFLRQSLAVILLFVGGKMLLHRYVQIPTGPSLLAILAVLAAGSAASVLWPLPAEQDRS